MLRDGIGADRVCAGAFDFPVGGITRRPEKRKPRKMSRVSRANQSVVRAALQQVFVQTDEKSAHATWREVACQLEKSNPA